MKNKNQDKFGKDKFDGPEDKFDLMDQRREEEFYMPPSQLEFTDTLKQRFAEAGLLLKWIRFRMGDGALDTKSIRKRQSAAEGYTFVTPDEIEAEELISLGDVEQFGGSGIITNGDLVLMKVRVEKSEARKAYYEGRTRSQSEAISERLRQNAISGGNKTVARTGKNAHFSG